LARLDTSSPSTGGDKRKLSEGQSGGQAKRRKLSVTVCQEAAFTDGKGRSLKGQIFTELNKVNKEMGKKKAKKKRRKGQYTTGGAVTVHKFLQTNLPPMGIGCSVCDHVMISVDGV
jgi:hypothetical protein